MEYLSSALLGILTLLGLFYLIFLKPKFKKDRNDLLFDNRVLGFIDGLYLTDINFGCPCFEMRRYVQDQLSKAHKLPGNQFLIEYTTATGWGYCSHTGPEDHALFAILCIALYAKESGRQDLVAWCESQMISVSKNTRW